jgi:hypothetical protein
MGRNEGGDLEKSSGVEGRSPRKVEGLLGWSSFEAQPW